MRNVGQGPVRKRRRRAAGLGLESLEGRQLLANVISGFVYSDANNNGLFDAGEPPLANVPVQLFNGSNVLVASTTTDAAGAYGFAVDQTVSTTTQVLTQTASVPLQFTNFNLTRTLPQFDPGLGTLLSVEITSSATTSIQTSVENLDAQPATLTIASTGSVAVDGAALPAGRADVLDVMTSQNDSIPSPAFDGVEDFGGTSGFTLPAQVQTETATLTLTDPADLAAFIGLGGTSFQITGAGNATVTGGGNLLTSVTSQAGADLTIVYRYRANNMLQPGAYTIVEPVQPAGFRDGLESINGVVLPNSIGTDSIPVVLGNADSPNNNFGERVQGTPGGETIVGGGSGELFGFVYVDANNNGIKEPGEEPIGGATVTLTGTTAAGQSVTATAVTSADGSYGFIALPVGTFAVTETQPAGFLDGKDIAGTVGGLAGNDVIATIPIGVGTIGLNYNFGELRPASIGGFVYVDFNNDGLRAVLDFGIANVQVRLTGTDDLGQAVDQALLTADDGSYRFINLRPGLYAITETQPRFFRDGKDTIGTPGGATSNDRFSGIVLNQGVNGVENNFGELPRPECRLILSQLQRSRVAQNGFRQAGPLLRFYFPTLVGRANQAAGAVARALRRGR